MKTQRELKIEAEESSDIPSYSQLVKIVQELTLKQIQMEEKMAQMQKWVDRKKRKINVIKWLNDNVRPNIGFLEWVNVYVEVKPEHFENLIENTIFHTLQQIFEHNLPETTDAYPITCFAQKPGTFYVYEDNEWRVLVLGDMVLLLKTIQNYMIQELSKWKEENQHKFDESDKISILFNKAVIKLMNISFTQDATMSRIKNGLFNHLERDLKLVDYDFEFYTF
jgi:hypothetical protein